MRSIVAAGSWSQDLRGPSARVSRCGRFAVSCCTCAFHARRLARHLGERLLPGAVGGRLGARRRHRRKTSASTSAPRWPACATLLERGAELLPELAAAFFDEVRVGLRPATPDELPVIGASSTMRGVFYATGHYRNGVLLAPLTALAVADLVLEGGARAELVLVRPDRFGL